MYKNTELTQKLSKTSEDLAIIKSNIDKNKTELNTLKTPELNAKLQVIESSRSIISESENIISSFEKEIEQTKQVESQLYKEIMAINKEMKPLEKSNKPDDQAKYKNLSNTYKKLDLDLHNKVYNKQYYLNQDISYEKEKEKIQENKEIITENENSSDIKHFRATEKNIILNEKILSIKENQKLQTENQLKELNELKQKNSTPQSQASSLTNSRESLKNESEVLLAQPPNKNELINSKASALPPTPALPTPRKTAATTLSAQAKYGNRSGQLPPVPSPALPAVPTPAPATAPASVAPKPKTSVQKLNSGISGATSEVKMQ